MNELQTFPRELAEISRFREYEVMNIHTEVDAGYVSDRRQEVKEHIKAIEAKRKSFTAPLLESKKRIDEEAKKIIVPLETIVAILDSKLLSWHKSQEAIRREEAERVRAEEIAKIEAQRQEDLRRAMLADDEKAAEGVAECDKHLERLKEKPIEVVKSTHTASAVTYVQTYWTFEVEDASLIPDEFWMLDEVKLGKVAREQKEAAQVPGVKFIQKERIGGKAQ